MKNYLTINKKIMIGMIHLLPTISYYDWPGMDVMFNKALADLKALEKGGADAALIENDADNPCQVEGKPDVVIPMTIVCSELSKVTKIPLGVEVLLNDPKASLMIAKTCNLNFIRTDYFVDRMERKGYGEFDLDTDGLMKLRNKMDAVNIDVLADVQVKYAKMIQDKSISQSVNEAMVKGASGVIVSGSRTGLEPLMDDVIEAKKASKNKVPIIIGSGLSMDNASDLMQLADWAIVGSSIKTDGVVDSKKVRSLVKQIKGI